MIINCTPHTVVVGTFEFPSSGIIPRVSTIETPAQPIEICDHPYTGRCGWCSTCGEGEEDHFMPAVTQAAGEVTGLPEPRTGVFLLVSGMVFAASDRPDLIAPDTGKTAVRDDRGHIVAVTRFLRK